jgi:hypothetical protein
MSVPSAELTAPSIGAPRRAAAGATSRRLAGWRLYGVLAAGALLVGALSLLIPSTPSYDPWAWIVWGREIVHLNLHTNGGPTWKPLPVVFTTVFSPFGSAAPDLWLVVARAGAVMAVVMVFRVAGRLTLWLGDELAHGATRLERLAALLPALFAGTIGVVGLVFSGAFIKDNALGYSEGLMTALVLIAIERHLDGHRQQAFAIGFFAALDRPEIWLFWGPYGLYLWWRDPGARKLVFALFALIPVMWFLPELWGSGHLLRGVNRAQNPRSNSPAFAACPFCKEWSNAWVTVLSRIKIASGIGVIAGTLLLLRALRARSGWNFRDWAVSGPRERAQLAIVCAGLFGLGWWLVIAVLTQAGFSGNNRYLILGAALIEISGAATWGWGTIEFDRLLRRRGPARFGPAAALSTALVVAVLAFAFVPGFVGNSLTDVRSTHRALAYQALLRKDAEAAVAKAGGKAKILACGSVMTEGFQVPMVAYYVGVHTMQIAAPARAGTPPGPPPNVIFQTRATRSAALLPLVHSWPTTRYRLVATTRTFRVFERCGISS